MNRYKIICLITLLLPVAGLAQLVVDKAPDDLQSIDVVEHLGEPIPLDLRFVDAAGDTVALRQYFQQGKPVVLTLHYTNCPMLCSLVLNGISRGVRDLAWQAGDEFQMLSVSIDPAETPQQSVDLEARYRPGIGLPPDAPGWIFLVGEQPAIDTLCQSLGFQYFYVEKTGEYAHPAVVFILTEEGIISRYFYGIEYKEQDLRLALLEASEGKIGNTIDKLILFCYHYDPDAEGYVVVAAQIMKLGGVATLILMVLFLGFLWSREKRKKA